MESLKNCIASQVSIDETSLDEIVSSFETVELDKGDFFLKAGTICRKMAFIESGYLRMYDIANGKEVTIWIGSNGRFITSLSSFVFQTSNFWNIQAITPCKMQVISRDKHFLLTEKFSQWLHFDNQLLAHSFALLEKNMFQQLHTTANERFHALMRDEPELFQNVPLQYIASMIGIAPESLSRLRKNLKNTIS